MSGSSGFARRRGALAASLAAGTAVALLGGAGAAQAATQQPSFTQVIEDSIGHATESGGMRIRCQDADGYVSSYEYAADFSRTLYRLTDEQGGLPSVILSEASGAYRPIPDVTSANADGRFVRAGLRALDKPSARFVKASDEPGLEEGIGGARWLMHADEATAITKQSDALWQNSRGQWNDQIKVYLVDGFITKVKVTGPAPETCLYSYAPKNLQKPGSTVLTPDEAYGDGGFAPVTRSGAEYWLTDVRDAVVGGVRATPRTASGKAIATSIKKKAAADLAGKWTVAVTTSSGNYAVVMTHRTTGAVVKVNASQSKFRSGSYRNVPASLTVGSERVQL